MQGLPLFMPWLYNNKIEYNSPLVQGLCCIGKTNQHNWETTKKQRSKTHLFCMKKKARF